MDSKSIKTYLTAIYLVLSICLVANAQQKPICVIEAEKMLVEAENTESSEKLSSAKADECIRQNPKLADALIVRSRILASKGDFNAALADANKAIELAPQNSDAFHARGFASGMRFTKARAQTKEKYSADDINDKNSATADFEKSLELNPKNGSALLAKTVFRRDGVGISYGTLQPDFNRAVEYLTASGNTAELARAHFERGKANSIDKWDTNGAINDFTTALKLRPNYLQPLIERARIYERKYETAKAVDDYRAALALNPNDPALKEKITKLAPTTPATTSQPATNSPKPSTAEQFLAEGRQKASQKDYDGAINSFSECLRLKPETVECYAFRGFARGMKGESTAAKPDFETAIRLAPNQPIIYFMRGLTFVQIGNKAEAVKDFRNVLRIDPNNRDAKAALQKLGEQP